MCDLLDVLQAVRLKMVSPDLLGAAVEAALAA